MRTTFNKIGDALDVSHVHLTRYMGAADYAMREAMSVMAYNQALITDELVEMRYRATMRPGAPRVSRSSTSAVRALARYSLSLVVCRPAGSTNKPGISVAITRSSTRIEGSDSASRNPGPGGSAKEVRTEGFAMSASTRSTSPSRSPARSPTT